MSSHRKFYKLPVSLLLAIVSMNLAAQDGITWLDDYTAEMVIGSDTYSYLFSSVDGNACKVEFKESVTDKKAKTQNRSWIFYLSDIDPEALGFKTRGKAIEVTLKTRNSQKFISYFREGELDAYTDEVGLKMNEVDRTRQFLETLREHIGSCRATDVVWEDREAAFDWLAEHVGAAVNNDVQWEQAFSRGEKPYLAAMSSRSVDKKGKEGTYDYLFDLSDIDPASVKLEVSGKSLAVSVPVRDGKYFIEVNGSGGKTFTDRLRIYVDEIEKSRQIVDAISFLVAGTVPERPEWDSYLGALGFVKANMGEMKAVDGVIATGISFGDSPAGRVDVTISKTGSDGKTEETGYSFYLVDMADKPNLEVSRSGVMVAMETRDDRDYIMKTSGESISGYASEMKFPVEGIDLARDIIHALEVAIGNSLEDIRTYGSVDEVNDWMEENLVTLYRGAEQYDQQVFADPDRHNQIVYEHKLTKDDAAVTETKYLIYPADISLGDLKIGVSMGRLYVALETEKDDYIRNFKNGVLQNFTDDVKVYFSDPLDAKNFVAAIRFLKENTAAAGDTEMSREEALSFLNANIPEVAIPGRTYEQKIEMIDADHCKLRFTRVEKKDDGASDEFAFEFMAADIDEGKSKVSVNKNLIEINLVTADNKKLIKPFKNGEAGDFDDDFTVYADDVLLGKKLLAAFAAFSKACRL